MNIIKINNNTISLILFIIFVIIIDISFGTNDISTNKQQTGIDKNITNQPLLDNNNNNKKNNNDSINNKISESNQKHEKIENPDGLDHKPINKIKNETNNNATGTFVHPSTLNFEALQRGFYIFLGLSVLVIAYILFRSSRVSKANPAQMVRKYGILAHKQDLEMRPLPLDEDDEDDTTVFDASGYTNRQQNI